MSGKMKKQTSSKKIQLINPDNDSLSPPETSAITTESSKAPIANSESRNLLANKKESIESIKKHQTEKKLLKQSQEEEEKLNKNDDKSGKSQPVEVATNNNKAKKSPYEIIFELNQQLANELEVCRKKNVLKESQIRELDSQNFSLREYITSLELSLEEFKSQYDQTIQENQSLKDKLTNGVKRDDGLIEKKASDLFNHLHLYLTGRPYEWSNTERVSTARPNSNDLSRVSMNASLKQMRVTSPQCESTKEEDEEMDQDLKDKNTESFLVEESVEEVGSEEEEEETENDDEEDEEEQDEEEEEDIEEVDVEEEEEEEEMDTDEEEADEEEMDTDEEEEPSETDIVIGKDQSEYLQQPTAEPGLFTILETSEMNDKTVVEEANVLVDETELIEEDELSTNPKETSINSLNETYDIGVPTLIQRKSVSFADNLVVEKNLYSDQQELDMPRLSYKKTPKPARPPPKSSYVDLEERPVRLNCEATDLRVVNKESNLKPPRPPKPILKSKEPVNENQTNVENESACDVKLLSSDEPLKIKSRKDSLNGKKSIESAESSNRRRSRVFSLSEPDETVNEANDTLPNESIQSEPLIKTPNLNASNGKPVLKPKTIFKSKQKAANNEENVTTNLSVMTQSADKAQNLQAVSNYLGSQDSPEACTKKVSGRKRPTPAPKQPKKAVLGCKDLNTLVSTDNIVQNLKMAKAKIATDKSNENSNPSKLVKEKNALVAANKPRQSIETIYEHRELDISELGSGGDQITNIKEEQISFEEELSSSRQHNESRPDSPIKSDGRRVRKTVSYKEVPLNAKMRRDKTNKVVVAKIEKN